MAKPQDQKPIFMTETSPIIMENNQEGIDYYDDDEGGTGAGCGCFRLFYLGRGTTTKGERTKFLQQTGDHQQPNKETWLLTKLKSLKEFSELVAGPRWKNFIRKFSKKQPRRQYQYDPQSYALNFNDGAPDEEDDGFLLRNFSTRFAPPVPVSSSDQQRRPTNL